MLKQKLQPFSRYCLKPLVVTLGILPMAMQTQAASLDQQQKQEVRELVKQTLLDDPQILVEVLQKLEQERVQAEQQSQKKVIKDHHAQLFEAAGDPILGNPKGSQPIVYFTDFNCPYCKRMEATLEQLADKNSELKIIVKELPVLGDASVYAAKVALAVQHLHPKQYDEFHRNLMRKPRINESVVKEVAEQLKLPFAPLQKEMESSAVTKKLTQNMELAQLLGIRGTPAMIVGDQFIPGAVTAAHINDALKKAGS